MSKANLKYLFIFAHPDDESVASAGTIRQLVDQGHHVTVAVATDGAAGEISDRAREQWEAHGKDLSLLRQEELHKVQKLLGFQELRWLGFGDGKITNKDVWGKLKFAIMDMIETVKPDVVVTHDHTGWYFHLDHVGVSIATVWAIDEAQHQVDLFLVSHFRSLNTKWKYAYNSHQPITHAVQLTGAQRDLKQHAYEAHASQNLGEPQKLLQARDPYYEQYELVRATEAGQQLLVDSIFQLHRPS
jgi:N-acetylglucosamine malate deacetylase 2